MHNSKNKWYHYINDVHVLISVKQDEIKYLRRLGVHGKNISAKFHGDWPTYEWTAISLSLSLSQTVTQTACGSDSAYLCVMTSLEGPTGDRLSLNIYKFSLQFHCVSLLFKTRRVLWNIGTNGDIKKKNAKIIMSYFLTPPNPQGHVMSLIEWSVSNLLMNLQFKFSYFITVQTF